jgi:Zn-dependent protease
VVRPGYNPFYVPVPPPHAGRPRITFSRQEVVHLAGAVTILTFCFAFVREGGIGAGTRGLRLDPLDLLASFLAVGSGFVLHELAHKVVAQRYGHWAEFRAQFLNLLFSLLLAAGTGFLFAAPGAVLIQGNVTRRENGLISLVGPAMNLLIAAATFPFTQTLNPGEPLPRVMAIVATANAALCVFNLLPFGPLDGRKVLAWSKVAYTLALAAGIGFLVLLYVRGIL